MREVDRALCFALGVGDEITGRRLAEPDVSYMALGIVDDEQTLNVVHAIANAVGNESDALDFPSRTR
jgi:hypothetical protein